MRGAEVPLILKIYMLRDIEIIKQVTAMLYVHKAHSLSIYLSLPPSTRFPFIKTYFYTFYTFYMLQ